ncbi:MAG: TlyA family RNA methyltransferase [Propionibacteriaceae bacterium]|nr:TlyA family RNA methyltransferase [Propionibacteriaceae bacterium]
MRLDQELVKRGLARSRSHGQQLIHSGRVSLNSRVVTKPAIQVTQHAAIVVDTDSYVSRAAHKLLGFLDSAGFEVGGRVLDVGASTGGFTQVLLERGASMAYAIDVGHGQLVDHIRDDSRVVVREGLNARDLTLMDVEGQLVDGVVVDVSFISLTLILEPVCAVVRPGGWIIVLVKPQFEVGQTGLDSRGVVVDDEVREQAVVSVIAFAENLGCRLVRRADSTVVGLTGNREVFCLFRV